MAYFCIGANIPEELIRHNSLTLHQARREVGFVWPLHKAGGKSRNYALNPTVVASDPALLKDALLAGEGLFLAMDASMDADVAAGRLQRVLPEWIGPPQDLSAVKPKAYAVAQGPCNHQLRT